MSRMRAVTASGSVSKWSVRKRVMETEAKAQFMLIACSCSRLWSSSVSASSCFLNSS